MVGTDMTIGADSALHRIVEAIDAISVHGREPPAQLRGRGHGPQLRLSGADERDRRGRDYVLIPEQPARSTAGRTRCASSSAPGRAAGRRDSIVIVAEGSRDRHGNPITATYVRQVLEDRLGEDTRVTILGHVQRGGAPSAFDRSMSSLLGYAAVEERAGRRRPDASPQLIGLRYNRVAAQPLTECVEQHPPGRGDDRDQDYQAALELRGGSYDRDVRDASPRWSRALPRRAAAGSRAGSPCSTSVAWRPGMNTAARAAVRLGLDRGHTMLGVHGSFRGLLDGDVDELTWGDVDGWTSLGGAELGISRTVPTAEELYAIARALERHELDGLLIIGGWTGYEAVDRSGASAHKVSRPSRSRSCACRRRSTTTCPGSELTVGADSALNRSSTRSTRSSSPAVAAQRCFVVETMGRLCGYLA